MIPFEEVFPFLVEDFINCVLVLSPLTAIILLLSKISCRITHNNIVSTGQLFLLITSLINSLLAINSQSVSSHEIVSTVTILFIVAFLQQIKSH